MPKAARHKKKTERSATAGKREGVPTETVATVREDDKKTPENQGQSNPQEPPAAVLPGAVPEDTETWRLPKLLSEEGHDSESTVSTQHHEAVPSPTSIATPKHGDHEALDVEAEDLQVIVDVKPHSPEATGCPSMMSLLAQVKELSKECFEDNCLDGCSKRGGWHVTLLAGMGPEKEVDVTAKPKLLLGFVVYRLKPNLHVLSVAKLAVPQVYRRRGYGRQLISWAIQYVKKLPEISCVSLASLPEAVPFYQRLGFRKLHVITDTTEGHEDYIPGQVYMEFPTRKGKSGRTGGRR